MRILFTDITDGVKFIFFFRALGLFLLDLAYEYESLRSFFFPWDLPVSSFFRFPISPLAVRASSQFIYFWALNSKSIMEVGGVFPNEKMRLGLLSPA